MFILSHDYLNVEFPLRVANGINIKHKKQSHQRKIKKKH